MELKQLAYFVAIVEEGTLSAAAKRLHVAQPPVSYQLKLLEEEFGVQLVVRGPRRISLTDAGKVLYMRARSILNMTDTTQTVMADLCAGHTGTLSIGTKFSSAAVLLSPPMVAFYKSHPDVRIELYSGQSFELIDYVKDGVVNVAIVGMPFEDPDEKLGLLPLPMERMVAVAHQDFLPPTDSISLTALRGLPLIVNRSMEVSLVAACRQLGFAPRIYCRTTDSRTSLMWANANLGVAIVAETVVDVMAMRDEMRCKAIEEMGLQSQSAIIWRKGSYLSAATRAFLQMFGLGASL